MATMAAGSEDPPLLQQQRLLLLDRASVAAETDRGAIGFEAERWAVGGGGFGRFRVISCPSESIPNS